MPSPTGSGQAATAAWKRLIILSVLVALLLQGGVAVFAAQNDSPANDRRRRIYQEQQREILLNLRHEIGQLSRQCFEDGMQQAATDLTEISLRLTNPAADFTPPREVTLPISTSLPPLEQAWRHRLKKLREDRAAEVYVLARRCLRNDQPTLAFDMVQTVLRLDPDHQYARAVIGQQLFNDPLRSEDPAYAGEWVSAFEAEKRSGQAPEVNHPDFGWIPISHVRRYEEGLRPWRGDWISAEKEAGLRRDFDSGWEIRSEHFLIKTNTSLAEGVRISRRLERFYAWLRHNLAAFFDTPQALEKRFDQMRISRSRRNRDRPMEVHYFQSRDEYNRRLRGKVPADRVTNGVYWEPDRRCYFFRNDEDPDQRTMFHEATHQILDLATAEHRATAARIRRRVAGRGGVGRWKLCENSNFWIIEGLASYFESFEINDGEISVGDPDFIRFVGAKQRLTIDNFYIPLRAFCSLGYDQFMQHPNVAQFYTQSSGVAHFLMHYDDGRYRDDLVTLLSAVYRPDLRNITAEPSLEQISGVSFEQLDQQYRDHISGL
ncbi:MAG: hypothetical protein Fues2KO_41380 [Fuerstiella sp.]